MKSVSFLICAAAASASRITFKLGESSTAISFDGTDLNVPGYTTTGELAALDSRVTGELAALGARLTALETTVSGHGTQIAANLVSIGTNLLKVGITQSQADSIAANLNKVGITDQQVASISENLAKVGITQSQADSLAANANKVGITQSQTDSIAANLNKVGITMEQADAIAANMEKVGITAQQAEAITGVVAGDEWIDFAGTAPSVEANCSMNMKCGVGRRCIVVKGPHGDYVKCIWDEGVKEIASGIGGIGGAIDVADSGQEVSANGAASPDTSQSN
jgi:hypothetical protein